MNAGGIRIDDELEGAIQAIDIFRVLPFKENITQTELTGANLLKLLQYGLVKRFGSSSHIQTYNLTYDAAKKTGTILGKPIVPTETYRIGFTAYFLQSLITKEILPDRDFKKGEDVRVALINYLDSLKK